MKRFIKVISLVLIFSLFFIVEGNAFWGKKKKAAKKEEIKQKKKEKAVEKKVKKKVKKEVKEEKKEEKKAAPVVKKKISEEELKRRARERAKRNQKRKQLNNTTWKVEVKGTDVSSKTEIDELVFEDNRFYSKNSKETGFNATNYTLSIKGDSVIWETMQTAKDGRIHFWRGDVTEDMQSMRGMLSKKGVDGVSENFSFISKTKTETGN